MSVTHPSIRPSSGSTRPLQVYLDSSDFSLLSDPLRATAELDEVLGRLTSYKNTGQVQFRFSAVHVFEAAPVGAGSQLSAQRRARLMHDLCGNCSMIGYLEIMKAEANGDAVHPYSDEGKWYPDITDLLPVNFLTAQKTELDSILKQKGVNREQRRRKSKEVFGRRGFKSHADSLIAASLQETIDDLGKVLPLSETELETLVTFARTGTGKSIAEASLRRVLADPSWIIERLATGSGDLGTALGWLRPAGAELAQTFGDIAKQIVESDQKLDEALNAQRTSLDCMPDLDWKSEVLETNSALTQRIRDQRKQRWKNLLLSWTNALAETAGFKAGFTFQRALTSVEAQARFPGIFTAVSVSLHSTQRAAATNGRNIAISDYGDMLHAVYAPYVDLYRPDAFMKDAISQAVRCKSTVVPRLTELPEAIERSLSRQCRGKNESTCIPAL